MDLIGVNFGNSLFSCFASKFLFHLYWLLSFMDVLACARSVMAPVVAIQSYFVLCCTAMKMYFAQEQSTQRGERQILNLSPIQRGQQIYFVRQKGFSTDINIGSFISFIQFRMRNTLEEMLPCGNLPCHWYLLERFWCRVFQSLPESLMFLIERFAGLLRYLLL